jgi:hypothetical protein
MRSDRNRRELLDPLHPLERRLGPLAEDDLAGLAVFVDEAREPLKR